MSRRAIAVVFVVVVLFTALVASARWNAVYQSRALVSAGPVEAKGPDSLAQNLALARGSTVRKAVQASHGSAVKAEVDVVDGVSLEFRARSRDRREAAEVANAYAQAYVELRRNRLRSDAVLGEGPESDRLRRLPSAAEPSVVVPARPARSPVAPWPSESWAVAGLALIALALAIPSRNPEE